MKQLRIGIVGSGLMGQEIGAFLAEHGYPVLLKGRKEGDIQDFLQTTRRVSSRQRKWGKISQEEYELRVAGIEGTLEFDSRFADLDLVIESIVENLDVKRALLHQLEALCSDNVILSSNTSTLSIAEIADVLDKKERFLGIHFFHPYKYFKFIEVVRHAKTSDEVFEAGCALASDLGKSPLPVKDSPGFFFNRVMMPSYMEVYHALESGWYAIEEIDEMFRESNLALAPLHSTDMTGVDIFLSAAVNFTRSIPGRFSVPSLLTTMVERGRLGKKVGKGFYDHVDGTGVDDEMQSILEQYRARRDESKPAPFSLEHSLLRIMNEAAYCVGEGVVTMEDAESTMKTVPPFAFTDGLFKYMDTIGIDVVSQKLRELEQIKGPRFKPAPTITDLVDKGWLGAKTGRGFFLYK